MEKNIPNDNLEKFLQKALENYEENPSEDLWGKIETELPAPTSIASAVRWRALGKWAAGIAAGLLIGLSVFQHFHHKAEIGRLTNELNQARIELQDLKDQAAAQNQVLPPRPEQEENPAERFAPMLPAKTGPALMRKSAIAAIPESQASGLPAIGQKQAPLSAFDPVPLPVFGVKADLNLALSAAIPPVEVLKHEPASRVSLGMQAGPAYTYYSRKGGTGQGHGPHEPIKSVNRESITHSRNIHAGISLNYDLTKNWSVETGLQYRKFGIGFSHEPGLKFGDGHPHGGGPGQPPAQDFNYYLDTPSGTVYVALSAGQTDPDEQISNQEELNVEIRTEDRMEFLSIPLLLGYEAGKGRFSGQVRAGLLANIGIAHEFEVSGLAYRNQKFKPNGNAAVKVGTPELNPVSFDYFLGAGLAYDPAPAWRVTLMPFLSGGLTKKFDALFKDPSDLSLGVSAGVSYKF